MTVRTVTGNINTMAGVNIPNATFSFVPETYVFGSTSSDVIFGDQDTVEADSNGDVSFDLHEGKYIGRISTTQGQKTFRFVVDSDGPWTLGRLIGLAPTITPGIIQEAIDAAEAAIRAQSISTISEKSAAYTIQDSDKGTLISSIGATAITVTIPDDATGGFTENVVISLMQKGAGVLGITAAAGVVLNGVTAGSTLMQQRYGTAQLLRYGVDEWVVVGLTDEVLA